jgi:hypothetical protein
LQIRTQEHPMTNPFHGPNPGTIKNHVSATAGESMAHIQLVEV